MRTSRKQSYIEHVCSELERAFNDSAALGERVDQAVREARDMGLSWREIGSVVGMTGQGAWKRWHKLETRSDGDA